MYTKKETYEKMMEIHQKLGQGLSGIVCIHSEIMKQNLEELIQEGLVKEVNTNGGLGDPLSDKWYFPTKGYCVFEDKDSFRSLSFLRFYLGVLEDNSKIEPSSSNFIQNPKLLEEYLIWLKKNKTELDIMMNMNPFYTLSFDKDCVDLIKSKDYYKNNRKVSKIIENHKEIISVSKRLIELYKSDDKYKENVKDTEKDILNSKAIISLLNSMNINNNIQEELKIYEDSFKDK